MFENRMGCDRRSRVTGVTLPAFWVGSFARNPLCVVRRRRQLSNFHVPRSFVSFSYSAYSSTAKMSQVQSDEIRANAYVGFETITRQIEHKLLKRGFQFNVIVVGAYSPSVSPGLAVSGFKLFLTAVLFGCAGQTGLGKSTLINTLFASHLVDSKGRFAADEEVRQTTEIHPVSHGELPCQLRSVA